MSSKPSSLPEWASDLSNVTEPSSGQKATGWTSGQDGVSSYENWKSELIYRWCEYVRDGEFEGDHSIDGALEVTGDLIVGDDIVATGDITTGGVFKHGTEVTPIGPFGAHSTNFVFNNGTLVWEAASGGDGIWFRFDLPVGANISSIGVLADFTGAGSRVLNLRYHDATGAVQLADTETVTTNVGWAIYNFTAIDHTLLANRVYWIEFLAGNAADAIAGLLISWDRP